MVNSSLSVLEANLYPLYKSEPVNASILLTLFDWRF